MLGKLVLALALILGASDVRAMSDVGCSGISPTNPDLGSAADPHPDSAKPLHRVNARTLLLMGEGC